jgi:hypothetical protein
MKSTKFVHISKIQAGDVVLSNGKESTVCYKDITSGGFCGLAIFGDSYKMGTKLVEIVVFETDK